MFSENFKKMVSIVCIAVMILVLLGMDSTNASKQVFDTHDINNSGMNLNPEEVFDQSVIDTTYDINQSVDIKTKKEIKATKELNEKRTKNSKTFLNTDNTISVQESTYSLHYYDGQDWQDIDNTLRQDNSDTNNTYIMKANNFKVKLNHKRNNQAVTFQVYNESVTYQAENMNNVTGVVYGNTITYPNAWQSTDLQYQVQNDQLKMELHLANNQAPKKYVFEMKLKGVKHQLNGDGSIDFIDELGKVNFSIPKLWVIDSSSSVRRYDRLNVQVKRKSNKALIEITLNDQALIYPLVIDPTTEITGNNSSYQASVGFASVQGQNNWYYQEWDGTKYLNLSWDVSLNAWRSLTNNLSRVWNNGQHPSATDSVRKWVAPYTGVVRITGNVAKQNGGGGDGVNVKILKNSVQVWPNIGWQNIGYNNTVGVSYDIMTSVSTGDAIYFILNKNGENSYDSTIFDPLITYVNSTYQASTDFSSIQGQNNWYYQEWDGMKYKNLNWDAVANRWGSLTNNLSLVWNNGQHPSATDSVRKWVTPVTGIVRITGNAAKQNGGGGDGVNVKILKNSVQVWPNGGWNNIAYNNTVGVNFDITLSVSAGDAIYFVLNKYGENSYDSTNFDPLITYVNSTYRASNGFNSLQGQNNWYYQEWDGTQYIDLKWDNAGVWRSLLNNLSIVWNYGQHPSATDSVRKWVAPTTGVIRISGNVAKENSGGGDGVNVKILKNSSQVWPSTGWKNIVYNDMLGSNYDITLSILAGDEIYFVLNKNGENSYDSTIFDPLITYVNSTYKASSGFSSIQGQNNWYYQEWDGKQYLNLNWDAGVWRSPINNFSIIWNNGQHPSATDSVRKWVAPVTGIVRVSGNVAKENSGGGDGVKVKILKNSTQMWPIEEAWKSIEYNNTVGVNYDITLSVSAGDAIYFILNKNGENSYDSTDFDPLIVYANLPSNQYIYDINNRLKYIQMPTGEAIQYQYDNNGNLLKNKKLKSN